MHQTGGAVECQIEGQAADAGVPRFRPWCGAAESALGTDEAQTRADIGSRRIVSAGRSRRHCRCRNGAPPAGCGKPTSSSACTVPRLGLADALLIGAVAFREDGEGGRRTELTVAPPAAFTPKPQAPAKAAGTTGPGCAMAHNNERGHARRHGSSQHRS